jgi:two-component system sensor histidine kinase BaeS
MVEDLQTLASAEAASLHLVREPCDLAAIASEAIAAMESTATLAGVRLSHQLSSVTIDGDPVRIHQIVTNLLSNAIKFGDPGSSASVRVERDEQEAVLVVADTGRGIDADELPHVFERFWRSQATTGPTGTGIGLAIVQDLVMAHGGSISIESEVGVGTRITAKFPVSAG